MKKKSMTVQEAGRLGGKIGGLSRSRAKRRASKQNGLLGGRPPKNKNLTTASS